jgi:ribosome-binding factor A
MPSRRTAKVAQAILETVSMTVLHGLKDPRIQNVTVIHVEVTDDIRSAKVYVSVRGNEKVQALSIRGLNSARGFLQAVIAERLQTKNTPILTFLLDKGVKKSAATSALIHEALAESASPDENQEPSSVL